MLENKGIAIGSDIILMLFTMSLFFLYFSSFFRKRKAGDKRLIIGVIVLAIWQFCIPRVISRLQISWNISLTIGFSLFVVANIYEGNWGKKSFFVVIFDAIWMLVETLVGNFLLLYYKQLATSRIFGAFTSKICFLIVILALRKVFMHEEVKELPSRYGILLMFIPVGSIYIMNAVFILSYHTQKKNAEVYSFISVLILLFVNVLIGYIYIKLADDLQIRKMNLVYEQQLELCERHKEEMEISILQVRDIRHSMRNHFISLLAYAERGECEKIIKFINDVMEEGRLKPSVVANTGNIVIDSLAGYWRKIAEKEGIEFQTDLKIPMKMPFKGADVSLILGNLLENAVEAARKVEDERYIRMKLKYDRKNLLISVENSYTGELIKTKGGELKTTKKDADNHGFGLASVQRTARKYHGSVAVDSTVSKCFIVRVVLYGK